MQLATSSVARAAGFFAHMPIDWIVLGAIVLVVAAETMRAGANRACSFALALPISFFLLDQIARTAYLSTALQHMTGPYAQPAILVAIFVIAYFLVHRIIGFYGLSSGMPIQSILVGIATAALAAVFWIQSPLASLWQFGPQAQAIFGEAYRLWWVLGAYLALAYARG